MPYTQFLTPAIPLRSKLNKNSPNPDFSMTAPLSASGSDFPCKGYLVDLDSPAGAPTASWPAGSNQKLGIGGSAAHNGGSCQLSLSYDSGKTFKVIKSIEGGCVKPGGGDNSFDFTVPEDAKSGDAVFAWTWFNQIGNREMYMNCAAVTITGSGTDDLSSNPDIFVANVNNGCGTTESTDVEFPDGGEDVEVISKAKLAPPTGTCGSSAPAKNPVGNGTPPPAGNDGADDEEEEDPAPVEKETPAPIKKGTPAPVKKGTPAPANGKPKGTTHTVKVGDVCATIAAQGGITVAQLIQNNPTMYVSAFPPLGFLNSLFLLFYSNSGCTNLTVGQTLNLRRRSRIMREYY